MIVSETFLQASFRLCWLTDLEMHRHYRTLNRVLQSGAAILYYMIFIFACTNSNYSLTGMLTTLYR
jgi:hypothetical protein